MKTVSIDWNEVWRQARGAKKDPRYGPGFWDKRAPEFARHAAASDYVVQFMAIMQPEPHWSVLDIGCGAGTLAVPLAASVKSITALDSSTAMLSILEERRREQGITNMRIVEGAWQDDWSELGIGVHDAAIASRSLNVDDLRAAVLKLQGCASRRVYLAALVDDGPYDRKVMEAVGRELHMGADYIVVYNTLRQLGIYANVAFTVNRKQNSYADVDEALHSMRWMVHEMSGKEEQRLREYLARSLVQKGQHWEMPYRVVERWAIMWWEKD